MDKKSSGWKDRDRDINIASNEEKDPQKGAKKMITINGTGVAILLAVGYFGVNAIVKGAPVVAKKVVKRIRKSLEEKIQNDK